MKKYYEYEVQTFFPDSTQREGANEKNNTLENNGSNVQPLSAWVGPIATGLGLLLIASPAWSFNGIASVSAAEIISQALVFVVIPLSTALLVLNNQLNRKKAQFLRDLKEILNIRKWLKKHPINNLTYALTQMSVGNTLNKPEKLLIPVHLYRYVSENEDQEDQIEVKAELREKMEGVRDALIQNENKDLKIRFIMESKRLEQIVEILIREYDIPQESVLSSVYTPEEAVKQSKGYRILYVVTMAPEMWKGLVKNLVVLLNKGMGIVVKGQYAGDLKKMMEEMGFTKEKDVQWNWFKQELTIPKENMKSKDLESIRDSEKFKIQA